MPDVPDTAPGTQIEDNSDFIQQAIPDWLKQASTHRIHGLKQGSLADQTWFDSLSKVQRQTLKQLNEASFKSQHVVDNYLAPIENIETFGARLLNAELKKRFNINIDINATYLRLNKPLKLGTAGIKAGTFRVMQVTLLQAALHNFEAGESEVGAFDASSGFTQHLENRGASPAICQTLTVACFISLCRTLDIGAAYQKHLKDILLPADAAVATAFRNAVITSQKDALNAAAYLALIKNDIRADDHAMILDVIDGERNPVLEGKPVWFCKLSLANCVARGCLVFHPCEKYHYSDAMLLYVPHDREHPLKRYSTFSELRTELSRQLLAPDETPSQTTENGTPGATAYQRFFSQFLYDEDKPRFFNRFTEPGPGAHTVRDAVVRSPISSSVVGALFPVLAAVAVPQELPPPQPGTRVRNDDPQLNIDVLSMGGLWAPNVDLWADQFERNRDKLLSDARHQATPTADVDARVRAEKLAHLLEGGLALLGLVSMFVPVLGELMMAAMAGQLLYETFEGVIEWSEGDKEAARQHLLDVAQNLALMALLAGAGKGLQRLASPPLIAQLKPVKLPGGEQRLWKSDLTPYASDISLPEEAALDDMGLHTHDQQPLLPLNGQLFALKPQAEGQTYRIRHPVRSDAYSPQVTHNGEGAWIHEAEEPLTWQSPQLMRRLGHRTQGLTDTQLEQVRVASGITPEQLRQLHLDHQPPPALLAESLARFRINQGIETFIERMSSYDPKVFVRADLKVARRVIAHKNLGFDLSGNSAKALALRAVQWRQEIAQAARDMRTTLFDDDYRAYDATRDPRVQTLKDRFPGLPSAVAKQLLETTTDAEFTALREHHSLSPRLSALARVLRQETRLSQAYEGLYVDILQSQDSRRLALHTLQTLPGWQQDLHIEVRQGSEYGPLLDTIGIPSAVPPIVLAVGEQGTFGTTDLYGAVLARLNQPQRHALGDVALSASTLKQGVQRAPLPRQALRPVLLEYPVFRTPLAGNLGLPGGAPLLNLNLLRTVHARVRKLYPGFTEEQVNQFIDTHKADVRNELTRRETQYATLKQDLKNWVEQSTRDEKARNPVGPNPGQRQRAVATALKNCWRRQTLERSGQMSGRRLEITTQVTLPSLSADFSHVEELTFNYVSLTDSPQPFLSRFAQLKKLTLNRLGGAERRTLTQLPEAITAMKELTHLDLSCNAIALDETSAGRLTGLKRLEELNLSDNPLGTLPDFSALPRLRTLNLRRTHIKQWPDGVLGMPDLQLLDLSDNQLSAVPERLLNPAAEEVEASIRLNRVTRLGNNPFTLDASQQMRNYITRMARTRSGWRNGGLPGAFEVPLSNHPLVARVRLLFPGLSAAETEQVVVHAGLAAETELARLEAQWQTLETGLDTWAAERFMVESGPDHIRAGDANDRQQFALTLKQCWRRLTPRELAHDGTSIGYQLDVLGLQIGELPPLAADFSHVGSIKLRSMPSIYGIDGFLQHFANLRWLDLSECNLRSIPPSLARMNRLTRLKLQNNRVTMTDADVSVMEGLVTLRVIDLENNPLARTPNFSAMTDLRGLRLKNTGITQWPEGLGAQPALEIIDLRNNLIASLPQAQINPTPEHALTAIRANNVTFIQGNPLSEEAQSQLGDYWLNVAPRYAEADAGRHPDAMRYQAPEVIPTEPAQPVAAEGEPAPEPAYEHWMNGLFPEEVTQKTALWESVAGQPGSQAFLDILENLKQSAEYRSGYTDLQARVWQMIEAAADQGLREELFATAGDPRCGDLAALVFSDMEIKLMTWQATHMASDADMGPALLRLAKGLFRLDEVEKSASWDIQMRERMIRGSALSEQQKREAFSNLEDVEIRLAFRMGLQERLQLPGQPAQARYLATGNVAKTTLANAAVRIERLDNSKAALQSLLGREFWREFVHNRYEETFRAMRETFDVRLNALSEAFAAGTLSDAEYATQAENVQLQLAVKDAQLIESLTLTDWLPCKGDCVIA
jgi:Leucine-rich repeat (LRR) protein